MRIDIHRARPLPLGAASRYHRAWNRGETSGGSDAVYSRPDEVRLLVEGLARGQTILARRNSSDGGTWFKVSNGLESLQLNINLNVATLYWTRSRVTRCREFNMFKPESTGEIRALIKELLAARPTRVIPRRRDQ